MTMPIAIEAVLLQQSAPVELYELDLAAEVGAVHRFCPQLNERGANVVWQGREYQAFPIRADGFEQRSSGALPRPKLTASNVAGTLQTLMREFDNLRGARVTRRRTKARYLDRVNFYDGNPQADPYAEWPAEVWVIDRCASRNRLWVEWELASPLDVVGVMLPGGTVDANHCAWGYRSSDCGYTGGPVAMRDDAPTADASKDQCSKRLSGCQLRFPNGQALPGGFFPGVGQLRQV